MDYFHSNSELQELSKNLHLIVLPSTLWAVHIHPEYHFIALLHMQLKSPSKLNIDKGVLVTLDSESGVVNASVFIQNELAYIPTLSSSIKSVSDISHLIYTVHNLKLCSNADNTHEYPQCCKYTDFDKHSLYCYTCLEADSKHAESGRNLWESIQGIKCSNSLSSDGTIVNNLAEETNLCYSENNKQENDDCNTNGSDFISTDSLVIDVKSPRKCANKVKLTNRNPSVYSCEFCSKTFSTKSHLQEHSRTHTGGKPFLCEICNKASIRLSAHQRHVLTHSNPKPNLCNICGKTFCQGYSMKDHLLTHSTEKPFECEMCHKVFAKSYNLKIHKKTHTGVRPFICSTCGKTYTTPSNLTTHVRSTHTNNKPYTCTNCHMAFVHPRYLRIHMRKHTGEKPYSCVICAKTFAKNIHLTVHMRTHTGEKPHICADCGKGFTTTGNLSLHKRVHHKDLNINAVKLVQ